jgi:hypothetical protein
MGRREGVQPRNGLTSLLRQWEHTTKVEPREDFEERDLCVVWSKSELVPEGWLLMFAQLTGSPMSLYDFYMYLKYIELSPENLEFYLWYVGFYGPSGLRPSANDCSK